MRLRTPAHAGTFYPATKDELVRAIEASFTHRLGPGRLPEKAGAGGALPEAYIVPHAGYMYSGPVAAHAYLDLAESGRPEVVILVGPNHTGLGLAASVWPEGVWRTPLGDVEVDVEVARLIVEYTGIVAPDEDGHIYEHSIEVNIPFLQYIYGGDFRIVPIVVLHQTLDISLRIAAAYSKVRHENGVNTVMIATSDLNHYEPYEDNKKKDLKLLRAIEEGSPERVFRVIEEEAISACGPSPIVAAVEAGRLRGIKPRVLAYANSGDVTGEKAWVVGYPAVKV
ncbi:MAG: AmmeMemoRadiSam system protein B [Aeropyrum sp.]|nr:AmmeMemoRadiSam system protein B [Aeropyrum sp.]MCE4616009.1 AmmeMemoRadiSam system protein B [Aeropyrum sp.]